MNTTTPKQQPPSLRERLGNCLELIAVGTWGCFLVALWYFVLRPSFFGVQQEKNCRDSFGIEQAGQVGDSFGILNAFFASLAAVAAFKAYWSQQRQLAAQQNEFASQRHESHLFFLMQELRQAARGVEYGDTLRNTRFGGISIETMQGHRAICHLENLFLGAIRTNEKSLPLTNTSVSADRKINYAHDYRFQVRRKELLAGIAGSEPLQLKERSLAAEEFVPALPDRDLRYLMPIKHASDVFRQFYEDAVGAPLGNVFRLQAAILRYIDNQSIPEPQREQHAELFKAQITDSELHLLLYYALSDLAGDEDSAADNSLRQIMMRYKILEALKRKKPEFIWHRIPEISYFEDTNTSPG